MNCEISTFSGAFNGCPEKAGGVRDLLIATTDPGLLAVTDLQSATFVQGLITADEPDRVYRLSDAFKEEIVNNTITSDAGTYRSLPVSEQAGVSMFKFESSLCLKNLYQELKFGKTAYIAYVSEKNYLGAQAEAGDPDYVRFVKVNLTSVEEKVTGTTTGLISVGIEHKNLNTITRFFPFVPEDDITDLEKVLLKVSPIVDTDTTVTIKAVACNMITPVTDLTIGISGTNKFEVTSNGVVVPGAVTQVGNVYTFTRTAGTFATGEVVTVKYENPSTSGEFYTSNTVTITVTV